MLPEAVFVAIRGNAIDSTNPQKLISQDLERIYPEPSTPSDYLGLTIAKIWVHSHWFKKTQNQRQNGSRHRA